MYLHWLWYNWLNNSWQLAICCKNIFNESNHIQYRAIFNQYSEQFRGLGFLLDLNSCDFHLHIRKYYVYQNNLRTIEELKTNVQIAVEGISTAILENVMNSFRERLNMVMTANGFYIEYAFKFYQTPSC